MLEDVLLEIGVEEIPSAYMPKAILDIKQIAIKELKQARLRYVDISSFGTPRRITLIVEGINAKQEDSTIDNKGPKKGIAIDSGGNPTKAGLGFARSQGVDFEDLEIREISGTEYLFAVKREKGRKTEELLPGILADIIKSLSFPRSMRWGYSDFRFARPIRWLLALYGKRTVKINCGKLKSHNFTYGHRFLSSGPIEVTDTVDYLKVLKENYVILDHNERKEMIKGQIDDVARTINCKIMANDKLLEEINFLVEYPTAFVGEFSQLYLKVPAEVLTTSMIQHQRYFPVFASDGSIMPKFVGVRNGTKYNLDVVIDGNQKVLKARLEDALFFFEEDTKKSLDSMALELGGILFHERLGTMLDKAERLKNLAGLIGAQVSLKDDEKLKRAAYLCKADLVSSMVKEFPELQGIMGRHYANQSGEDQKISNAIYEHYLPRSATDDLPISDIGRVLSLAEKIDNIVGCFSIGIKPTGSQDPYALRRQAIGIVHIILSSRIRIDLLGILQSAYDSFAPIKPDVDKTDTIKQVMEFIFQRMKGILLEKGIPHDVIDAVLMKANYDLNDIVKHMEVIQKFKNTDTFADFIVIYNRANNLSKGWGKEIVDEYYLIDESEKQLYHSFSLLEKEVKKMLQKEKYQTALTMIAGLRSKVDYFFESVMVMVEDEKLRANRLSILKAIANLCNSIADFSKIV